MNRILSSEVFWRYIDAYSPRVFGLLIHTILLYKYGASGYALPAWTLGVFGIVFTIVPDPHSYILVRRKGAAAQRLLRLTIPSLIAKTVCCFIFTIALLHTSGSELRNSQTYPTLCAFSACLFAAAESNWSVLGTVALATNTVMKWAIKGLCCRMASAALLLIFWRMDYSPGIWFEMAITSTPLLICLVFTLPLEMNIARSITFFRFGVSRYSVWTQAVALTTTILIQLPALVLGFSSNSVSGVGQISYLTRLLQAALQPIQIMQSIVIRNLAHAKSANCVGMINEMKGRFTLGAGIIAVFGMASTYAVHMTEPMDTKMIAIASALTLGISISGRYRLELASILATGRVSALFLHGYLPTLVVTILLTAILSIGLGPYGIAVGTLIGWLCLSFCWAWVKDKQ